MEERQETGDPRSSRRRENTQRVLVAFVGIPIALFCVIRGGLVLLALAGVFALGGLREYNRLAFEPGDGAVRYVTLLGGVAFLVLGYAGQGSTFPLATIGCIAVAGLLEISTGGVTGALGRITRACFGAIYIGLPFAHMPMLRELPEIGVSALLFVLFVTWGTDSAAFFVGRSVGRHKLSRVSPSKSVEGSVGGLLGAMLVGLAFRGGLLMPVWEILALSACTSIAGQLGDLLESLIKRDAGVKDSGRSLPGHGGVLDRIDSLLISIPVAYYLISLLI